MICRETVHPSLFLVDIPERLMYYKSNMDLEENYVKILQSMWELHR